jgi:glycosyltransferase involved in cell wall biosynthesis
LDIVCISSVDWEPLWTRKQQIMSRLPQNHRILYVEPPISFLSPFKDPGVAFKKEMARTGIRPLNENIWLLSPPVVLPFASRWPGINRLNQRQIARSIRAAMQQLGFKRCVLWTYLHTSCHLLGQLDEVMRVYDCVDEHSAYEGFNPSLVKAMERQLLKSCDLVFCTARGLYESKKPYCERIFLSPNAADIEHFRLADDAKTPIASELENLPRPILGFVGAIKEWIDLDLILYAARSMETGSVVMVGSVYFTQTSCIGNCVAKTDKGIDPIPGRSTIATLKTELAFVNNGIEGAIICIANIPLNGHEALYSHVVFYSLQ